jgi:hypothetical protein
MVLRWRLFQVDGNTVNLVWSPDSGWAPRADIKVRLQLRGTIPVHAFTVDWGDGTPLETVPGCGLPNFTASLQHTYWADSVLVVVTACNDSMSPIEAGSVAVSIARSSNYLIHQFRVERFKGEVNYHSYNKRWLQDWVGYTGSAYQLNFNDTDAPSGWTWGYRLWLREVDDQGRPGLLMSWTP